MITIREICPSLLFASLFVLCVGGIAPRALEAQSSRKRSPVMMATVTPAVTTSGSDSKYIESIPLVNKAYRDYVRGRHAQALQQFELIRRKDKKQPVARRYLAEILIDRGDFDTARKLMGSSRSTSTSRSKKGSDGPVPLFNWNVLAPFKYEGRGSLKKEYEPEKEPYNPTARYKGDGQICRWRKAEGPRVDFRRELDIEGSGVGYGDCDFVSTKAGWVKLGVASADGIKMWLNGQVIHENSARRDISEDADTVFAWLERGKNRLRVKVDSRGDEFRFYIQVYEDVGEPSRAFLTNARNGLILLGRKKWDDARKELLEAEAARPDHPEVAIGIARSFLEEGNLVAARSWANRGLAKRPGSATGLVVYGRTMLALGQPLKAFDSLRAAYRASEYESAEVFDLWIASAQQHRWGLQEGLAQLDKARGLRKAKKAKELEAVYATAEAKLASTFVGLADLSLYHREGGDRKKAAELGVLALTKLSPEQVALHCSAQWLLDLVKDLRATQPDNQAARESILQLVERVDPTRSDLIREILALKSVKGKSAVSPKIEALLKKRPEKALYKEYVNRLFDAGDHEKCVEICRQGLAAGIVSRTLRIKQAYSLLALKRFEESEDLFKGLLEEKDYIKRANEGLKKVAAARQSAEKGGRSLKMRKR